MIDSTVHIGNICLYVLLSVFFFVVFLKLLEWFVIVKLLKLQLATKLVEILCPTGPLFLSPAETQRGLCGWERGFSDFLLLSQGGNKVFPPHPLHAAVLLFELPVENNKHPNFE